MAPLGNNNYGPYYAPVAASGPDANNFNSSNFLNNTELVANVVPVVPSPATFNFDETITSTQEYLADVLSIA
jgi:hypothetical protein